MELKYPEGATPLDPNEIDGRIPTHITTKAELDRWEQDNINEALGWIQKRKPEDILNESFMKLLQYCPIISRIRAVGYSLVAL